MEVRMPELVAAGQHLDKAAAELTDQSRRVSAHECKSRRPIWSMDSQKKPIQWSKKAMSSPMSCLSRKWHEYVPRIFR